MTRASRTFRIFVSSTFSDLKEERDALQQRVFPRLRELCMQHGARFQAIDLRWGVSEQASHDQQTMKICLEEIARCQRVTPRPNFVVLLGERYGWRPLPAEIPAWEFEEIERRIVDESDRALIRLWYRRDDNAVPAVYCLQPRSGEFEEYPVWEKWVERPLRSILLQATAGMELSAEDRLRYVASATEQEIARGALQVEDASDHVFCFFRRIEGLPQDASAKGFLDLTESGNPDSEARQHLERLKNQLRELLPGNVHEYETGWSGDGAATGHIGQLCEDVYESLSGVILEQIARLEQVDPLEKEIADHDAFGDDRARCFTGRASILQDIAEYIRGPDRHPLVVFGTSGTGKTALLARAVREALESNSDAQVIFRFLGATPSSSNERALVESLCRQMSRCYGMDESTVPADYRQMVADLPKRLALATPYRPLILFLDALDQLSDTDRAPSLAWLPADLPDHVRLIVSTLPGECLMALKKRLPSTNLVELRPMSAEEGKTLLDLWLEGVGRALQSHQRNEVLGKFEQRGLPLYLKLAFEEARRWKSYTEETELSPDVPRVICDLLARLSSDANHGRMMVSRSLGYLAAAKNGLSEDELLDVLSLDEELFQDFMDRARHEPPEQRLPVIVWSRLFFDLEPYLTERSADGTALMAFYHRQLSEVVTGEYLAGEGKRRRHEKLAEYFERQPLWMERDGQKNPNARKLSELPYQQTHGELWADLEQKTLCQIEFVEAKCTAGMVYDLLADYGDSLINWWAEDDPTAIRAFSQAITREAQHLALHPGLAFPQVYYQLAASPAPEVQHALRRAQGVFASTGRTWWRTLLRPPDRAVAILAEHADEVSHIVASPHGSVGVSASTDGWVVGFDVRTGEPMWQERAAVIVYDSRILHLDGSHTEYGRWARPDGLVMAGDGQRVFLLATEQTYTDPLQQRDRSHHVLGYDVATGEELCRVSVPTYGWRRQIEPSPNGERIIGRDEREGMWSVWDAGEGQRLKDEADRLSDLGDSLLAFDGRFALSCQGNSMIMLDVRTGTAVGSWQEHADPRSAAISPNRRWLAVQSSEQGIRVRAVPSGTEISDLKANGRQLGPWQINPDNRCLVALAEGHLVTWEVATGHLMSDIEVEGAERFRLLAGGALALVKSGAADGSPMLCDLHSGEELGLIPHRLDPESPGHRVGEPAFHDCVASSARGWQALMSVSCRAELWELESLISSGTGDQTEERTRCMALAANGRWLLNATHEGRVLLRDLSVDGLDCRTLAHSKGIAALTISENGERAGWVTKDGDVTVVELQTGHAIGQFSAQMDHAQGCKFLSDGREMLIWSSNGVRLWDLSPLKCRLALATVSGWKENPAYTRPLLVELPRSGDIEVYHTMLRSRIRRMKGYPVSSWHFDPQSRLLVTVHERSRSHPRNPYLPRISENAGSRLWRISHLALAWGWLRSSLVWVFSEVTGLNLVGFEGESSREGPYCDRCVITKGGRMLVYRVPGSRDPGLVAEPVRGCWARQVDRLADVLEARDRAWGRDTGDDGSWASRRLAACRPRRLVHSGEVEDFAASDDGKAVVFVGTTGRVGRCTAQGTDTVAIFAADPLVRCLTDASGLHVAALDAHGRLHVFALQRGKKA